MSCCNSNCNHDPCGSSFNQSVTKAAQYAQYAQTQANAAAQSADDANNTWLEFNALYLGSFAVAPTTDNEGNPLQEGALYFNSVSNEMFVWQGGSWITFGFDEFTPFTATGTTTARNLVTRTSDIYNVKDFGAVGNGVTDNQAAFQAAINAALAAGGGTIYIPKGTYWFPHIGTSQAILNVGIGNLTFKGDGDSSILKFHEGTSPGQRNLFEETSNNPLKGNLCFTDIQFQGTLADRTGVFGTTFFLYYYKEIVIKSCKFYNIAGFAMDMHFLGSFKCIDSHFENIAADGIRARDTKDCIITGNTLKRTGDDPIALHTETGTLTTFLPQRERMIVSNNTIINCWGTVKAIGAKKFLVSNNSLHLSGSIAVSPNYFTSEGGNPTYDISIVNNIITDSYSGSSSPIVPAYGIILTVQKPKAGTSTNGVIPGDYDSITNKIVYPWDYNQTSNAIASNSIPRASNIKISGNIISRTKKASVFTDFGEGTRNDHGVSVNPTVSPIETDLGIGVGIAVFGNAECVSITDNNIKNEAYGIYLNPGDNSAFPAPETGGKIFKNGIISNNCLFDCRIRAIQMSIASPTNLDILITNNSINGDPYRLNTASNINGTYTGSSGPVGIYVFNAQGFSVINNKFKNLYTVLGGVTNWNVFEYRDNIICSEPVAPFLLSTNKGVADLYYLNQAGQNTIIVENSDPTSATYLNFISKPFAANTAQPSSGWYPAGWFVKNINPVLDANGMTISGWTRLTTGTGHVAGVDWAVARVSNVSPAV